VIDCVLALCAALANLVQCSITLTEKWCFLKIASILLAKALSHVCKLQLKHGQVLRIKFGVEGLEGVFCGQPCLDRVSADADSVMFCSSCKLEGQTTFFSAPMLSPLPAPTMHKISW